MGEALLFQKFSAISSAVCLLVPRCELSAVQATVLALPHHGTVRTFCAAFIGCLGHGVLPQ